MPLSVQAAEIAKRMIAASTGAATLMAFLRSTYEAAADLAATKDGVLWWSTGTRDAAVWHTLDLRTI